MAIHTSGETRTIEDAWRYLLFLAESDYLAESTLLDALKMERPHRDNLATCKALLVTSAAQGMLRNGPRVGEIFGLARGCLLATVVGAGIKKRGANSTPANVRKFRKLARAAHDANWASVTRALDAIAGRISP